MAEKLKSTQSKVKQNKSSLLRQNSIQNRQTASNTLIKRSENYAPHKDEAIMSPHSENF